MKFVVVILLVLVGLLILGLAAAYWIDRPITLREPVSIIISSGDGTREIAARLDSANLIVSQRVFRWLAQSRHIDRKLRPGKYTFTDGVRLTDILKQLHEGNAVMVGVTIPEGWPIAKMAPYLANLLGFSADSFLTLTRDRALLAEWAPGAPSIEGYLAPNTYTFYWGVSPRDVLLEMLLTQRKTLTGALAARIPELGLTRHQALTLASLIEAESARADERRLISGVFHNRLREGWLLQCDPTVAYAMGGLPPGRTLSKDDLAFDSPYNTYLHAGLPPGPICSPGYAAIRAALYPDSTDAMYFVADGSGGHVFSKTLGQHNTARVQIKRELRSR